MGARVEEGRQTVEQGSGKHETLRLKGDRDKRECFLFHVFVAFYHFHLYLDQCILYNKKKPVKCEGSYKYFLDFW